MIFTKGSGYALRALIHLAQNREEGALQAKSIAEAAHIPLPTLAKIMNKLTMAGIVESQIGPKGGFWLNLEPEDITLRTVTDLFETQRTARECLLGFNKCPGPKYCTLHRLWFEPAKCIDKFLDETTLAHLVE